MRSTRTLRVARPTDQLDRIAGMYAEGLGFTILSRFAGHDGFDGVILGRPGEDYHLEFTLRHGHTAGRAPTDEHLLVLYIADQEEWARTCVAMAQAGFREVKSANPYWDVHGRTFADVEGYRVVLQHTAWPD